ncbi:hypothetical protein EYZ11_010622 [Aspergillus tanneri]|uniref:Uncharacterized protein n=1 Tax=Aspergillus tanneri TaxID=1220188 RepID=A0A4S3J574_9EURO|nr:hypothetical protein EYZ11_010622 [Aspergillus tanneri]
MISPQVKQEILEKAHGALTRILDGNYIIRLEAEDNASPSPARRAQTTRRRQLSVSEVPSSTPSIIDESDSSSNNNTETINDTSQEIGRHSGQEPSFGAVDLMDLNTLDSDLAAAFEEGSVPPTIHPDDLDNLRALVDAIGPLPAAEGGFAAGVSESLFVPQVTDASTSALSLPPLPSPDPDTNWPATLNIESMVQPSFLHTEDPFGLGISLSNPIELNVDMIEPAPEAAIDPVAELSSEASSNNSEGPSNPQSHSSPAAATARAMEELGIALEGPDPSAVSIDCIPPDEEFMFAWGSYNGTTMRALLEQLTRPVQVAGGLTVDYFTRKLMSLQGPMEIWVGTQHHLNQLLNSRRRVLVVCGPSDQWSLVEIESHIGTVVHYRSSHAGPITPPSSHDGCSHCIETVNTVGRLLRHEGKVVPAWQYRVQDVTTWTADDKGLWAIWVTRLRVEQRDPSSPAPANFRLTLAREIFADFKAVYSTHLLRKAPGHVPTSTDEAASVSLQEFWIDFGRKQGFDTRLWDRVQELATRYKGNTRHQLGPGRASELLLMALNIASPDVLVTIKECMGQLRERVALGERSYSDSLWGTFNATRCHVGNQALSAIGTRLGMWKLQDMKEMIGDDFMDHIMRGKPSSSPVGLADVQKILEAQKGSYWGHLVKFMGNGNPAILCLIPRKVSIRLPQTRKLNTTSYRDLAIPDCQVVGQLFEEFRPGIISAVDAELPNILLYLRDPEGYYLLEDYSDEEIMAQKLSSNFFVGILRERVPRSHSQVPQP